ncbi:MAG: radical SAM protein [Candidatus Omnitrophica bacterium]|nr:radical SAM protein [Candidatus Omnitrophota bacterium]
MKCRFCYDLDHLNLSKGFSLRELKTRMSFLKSAGVNTVDLTGGEPTVRADVIGIIRLLKEDFGIKNICIITNGFKLSDKSYMEAVVNAGVNEFLFSIHGASSGTHDSLVHVTGSFDRVVQALDHASRLGVRSRVNTTVTAKNYDKVNNIAAIVSRYKIENYNLIFYNPVLDAGKRADEMAVKYSVAAPFLKDVIDQYARHFDCLHVKYIPFCFMEGYEKYVVNLLQTTYVPYEWDFNIRGQVRRGLCLYWLAAVAGLLFRMDLRSLGGRNLDEVVHDSFLLWQESMDKHKSQRCGPCRHSLICAGIWNGYYRIFNDNELKPVSGEKIFNPCHFMTKGLV